MQLLQEARVHPLSVRARTRTAEYRPLGALLLPGEIVHEGSVEDAKSLVDTHFHSEELQVLRFLGATGGPSRNTGARQEPWFIEYRRLAEKDYLERLKESGSAPNRDLLDFRDRPFAGPLTPLMVLSPPSRARYTTALLRTADDLESWTFAHTTQTRYPEHPWPHPVVYMVRKHGLLETSVGPRPPTESVGPGLARLSSVLPIATVPSHVAQLLGLPDRLEDLDEEHWSKALELVRESDDDGVIGNLYAEAARVGRAAPATIRCRVSSGHDARPAEAVTVASDPELISILSQTGEPYVRVGTDSDRRLLVEAWLLRDTDTAVRSEVVSVPSGEPEALGDVFPLLRSRLSPQQRELLLQPCSDIRVDRFTDSGRIGEARELVLEPEVVHYRGDLDQKRLLQLLGGKLGLNLTDADIDAFVRNVEARRVKALKTAIRKAPDNPTRVLLAIGAAELRARLPKLTLDSVEAIEGDLDDAAIGELALVIHGTRVLQEHADVLEEGGLQPPQRWAGGRKAVTFVRELGFGVEFAGFEARKVERLLEVEGPPEIGPLHDYQEIVVEEIRALVKGEGGGSRGLLSLPTGAGKTRVAIEALIDAINEGDLQSPVIWVAQTVELCEQAVQTWSELWRAKGPRDRLTISRLHSHFEADEAEHGHQVVVATTAKLDAGVFEKSSYAWLSRANCIVVDEAHTSVGQSYSRLLAWQGMERNKERAPLIGLTATPFRGNEAEMKTLVSRYGRRRLDTKALGGQDAYPHLQRIGILAQVDHELLPGSDITLSAEELKRLETFQRLPDAARQRLAADVGRNRTLLDSISALDADWPVLLFGVSVEHAHTMAALLSRADIPAAAISADTDRGVRRHYIDQFRKGRIRVLANYDVLAAGFDAPRVRASTSRGRPTPPTVINR